MAELFVEGFTMSNNIRIRFLVAVLLCFYINSIYGGENHPVACRPAYGALSYLPPPRRVLLVPLLSRDPETQISERWAEQPARIIASFYRVRFNADVQLLPEIWSWADYYREVAQTLQLSPPFDRLIFVGHGGFDGPVLKNNVFSQNLTITGDEGKLLMLSEAQPGLKNIWSITYNVKKNKVFADYISEHRQELARMNASEIWQLLKGLEKQLQPLDHACFNRYCSPDKLAPARQETYEYRINLCELVCREPLFALKSSVEISSERFFQFISTLNSLVTADGLIFFGACNPGSSAPDQPPDKNGTQLLINTTLAGGPYQNYVDLVSSVTGRITAGPIGQSSAEDIVNRIILFETNHPQRYLCIAGPARP